MPQYPGVQKAKLGRFRIRFKARDPKTGRVKEVKKVVVAATPAEAAKAKQQLREQFEAGRAQQMRVRVADFATSWLRGKLRKLKPSTAAKYATVLDHHVVPTRLGDCFVDALEPSDIVKWLDEQHGKASSINGRLRVLRTLLTAATTQLRLAYNPASGVQAIREEEFREEDPNRLTAEQLRKVLAALQEQDPERYPLFLTLALTGARVGEVTALKWGDVDFDAGLIHIRRARWKKHIGTTKTGKPRQLAMPAALASALKAHRTALIQRQAAGLNAGWVFPSGSGSPVYNSTLHKPLKRALAAAGITERFTIHGFRRTFNNLSRQVASGEVVRAMTGHSDERMTIHYSHVESEEKRKAVNEVLRLVYPSTDEGGLEGGTSPTERNKKTS